MPVHTYGSVGWGGGGGRGGGGILSNSGYTAVLEQRQGH